MEMPLFKAVVNLPLLGGGQLVLRLCREDELTHYHDLMREHHYLKRTTCQTSS